MTVPSPCIDVCKLSPVTDLCLGCFRNKQEIRDWKDADDHQKRAILERAQNRRS